MKEREGKTERKEGKKEKEKASERKRITTLSKDWPYFFYNDCSLIRELLLLIQLIVRN